MATIQMKELLEAGVHFGHQTRRWNPKMKPFIFGKRNGIHIIDLQKTSPVLRRGRRVRPRPRRERSQRPLRRHQAPGPGRDPRGGGALRQFYVNHRWLGGTLTNFRTIRKSIERFKEIEGSSPTRTRT